MNALQDLHNTVASRVITLFDREVRTEFALHVAGVSRTEQQVAGAGTEVEVSGFLVGEGQAQFKCFLFSSHRCRSQVISQSVVG